MPALVWRVALLFALGLGVQGCGKRQSGDEAGDNVISATDALGRQIVLREYPRRIVSTAPSNTGILLALGLRERLVGVSSFYGFPEKVEGIEEVGGYINPGVEKVVSLRPDLVLAARGNSRDAIEQMRRHGAKVFTLDTKSMSGLFRDIKTVGRLTGTTEKASRLVEEMQHEILAIRQKVSGLSDRDRPRVLWLGQEYPLRTAGPGSLIDEFIRLAGGTNVAGDEKRAWPSYSMEEVLLKDPQVIILSEDKYKGSPGMVTQTLARFRNDSVWSNISAVREGRVHFIPTDLLGQPSPDFVEGLKLLAKYLHPSLFPEHADENSRRHGDAK